MAFKPVSDKETLPAKVVRAITDSILSGELKPGDPLPTEPDLSSQFGVSRSVIRDACKMLTAKGLIEVVHGKGVFVSQSQAGAFSESLLLALSRDKATSWDVEQFYAMIMPEIFALAAVNGDPEDFTAIQSATEQYVDLYKQNIFSDGKDVSDQELTTAYTRIIHRIFAAAKNKVVLLLGPVFYNLRQFREVLSEESPHPGFRQEIVDLESRVTRAVTAGIVSGDPEKAKAACREMITFSDSLKKILQKTPVGQMPKISLDMLYPDNPSD